MNEIEQKVWELHDRRLNEHDSKFNEEARISQEIKDTLKQLMERINEGVSKTQQKILEENKSIEISMRELAHSVEMGNLKINDKVDTVHSQLIDRIEPLEQSNRARDKVYVWGVLAGLVLGLVGFATTKLMEKFWPKEQASDVEHVSNIRARPLRN